MNGGGSEADHCHYCTFFDQNFLANGIALHRSLMQHGEPFTLWVLCFDDTTYQALRALALPGMQLIALQDLERGDEALLTAKQARSRVEYFFTCTPSLPLYVLEQHPNVDSITYLDADLYFFDSPKPIHRALAEASILIIGHRFPPHLRYMENHGIFNVGLLTFRRTSEGLACLRWWRERCLEWCFDRVEPGRFADQKYLDDWPQRFAGVTVLEHKGAGLAPWNISNYTITEHAGAVFVDEDPLVFYHFHRLVPLTRWLHVHSLGSFGHRMSPVLRRCVYAPYVRELRSAFRLARTVAPSLRPRRGLRYTAGSLWELLALARRRELLLA